MNFVIFFCKFDEFVASLSKFGDVLHFFVRDIDEICHSFLHVILLVLTLLKVFSL